MPPFIHLWRSLIRSYRPPRRFACAVIAMLAAPHWFAANLPANHVVVVVLDDSGSMFVPLRNTPRLTKMAAAQQALTTVIGSLDPDTQLGIVVLNHGAGPESWVVPLGPIDKLRAERAIESIQPSGGTPLGYFLKVGADALLSARKQRIYGTYRLLVVTDGEATDAPLVADYLPQIIARGITLDVIGVDLREDHSLASSAHSYRRADDPESLTQAISDVFAESTGMPHDAGDSDFSTIAGFPDDLALAALKYLAHPHSAPIGQPIPSAVVDETAAAPSENTDSADTVPSSHGVDVGATDSFGIGGLCFLASLLVLATAAIAAAKRIIK